MLFHNPQYEASFYCLLLSLHTIGLFFHYVRKLDEKENRNNLCITSILFYYCNFKDTLKQVLMRYSSIKSFTLLELFKAFDNNAQNIYFFYRGQKLDQYIDLQFSHHHNFDISFIYDISLNIFEK